MAIVKSNLLKQLSKNYPNFLKKDLEKFTNIILKEIKQTLKKGERVELRGFGIFYTKTIKEKPLLSEFVFKFPKLTIYEYCICLSSLT